jgi:hypothetical protein
MAHPAQVPIVVHSADAPELKMGEEFQRDPLQLTYAEFLPLVPPTNVPGLTPCCVATPTTGGTQVPSALLRPRRALQLGSRRRRSQRRVTRLATGSDRLGMATRPREVIYYCCSIDEALALFFWGGGVVVLRDYLRVMRSLSMAYRCVTLAPSPHRFSGP